MFVRPSFPNFPVHYCTLRFPSFSRTFTFFTVPMRKNCRTWSFTDYCEEYLWFFSISFPQRMERKIGRRPAFFASFPVLSRPAIGAFPSRTVRTGRGISYRVAITFWSHAQNPSERKSISYKVPPDLLLLDRSPNIGPLISRWKLDKFKNCWNKQTL